jgi:hypothetical protein
MSSSVTVPLAAQTGSVLTLVIPLGVFVMVAIWYAVLWRKRIGER